VTAYRNRQSAEPVLFRTAGKQFSRERAGPDTGQLNAYFRQAAVEARSCGICGAANGPNYTYCHNCQERL